MWCRQVGAGAETITPLLLLILTSQQLSQSLFLDEDIDIFYCFADDEPPKWFDLATAPVESLDPDPRVRWLRDAYLVDSNDHGYDDTDRTMGISKNKKGKNDYSSQSNSSSIETSTQSQNNITTSGTNVVRNSLFERMKDLVLHHRSKKSDDDIYPVPSRPHAIPLHRALSCDVKFCLWLGPEGYIKALVEVDPSALTKQDERVTWIQDIICCVWLLMCYYSLCHHVVMRKQRMRRN